MSDMRIQDLFNFLSHFRGDSAKEKLENLEETCGDGDGKLVRNEFRNAVRQNEDMIKAYGWNGERSNMDDLADIWFAKLDTIKSSSKVEGTYYNNDGTLTEGEEAGANSLAKTEGFLSDSGWKNRDYKEELRNADFSMISKYKEALEQSKLLVKQHQDLFNKSTDEKVKAALEYINTESTEIEENGIREYTQNDLKTLQSHCAVLKAVVELEDKKSDCIHDVVAFQSKYPDDAEEVNAIINKHFTDDYVNYINSQTDIKVLEQKLSAFTKDVAAFEAAKNPPKTPEVNGGEGTPGVVGGEGTPEGDDETPNIPDVDYTNSTDNITPTSYIDSSSDWKTGQNDVKKYMKEELKKNLNTLATTLITQGYSEDIVNAAMAETLNLYNGIIDSWPSADYQTGKYVTYSYTNSKTGMTKQYKAYTQCWKLSKTCGNWCDTDENTLGITFSRYKPDGDSEYKGLINFNKVKKVFETFCQELNDYQAKKIEFNIVTNSSLYDKSKNTFTMSQGSTTEFDITDTTGIIKKDNIQDYSFEIDSSYVEYLGNGKFRLTAPASSSDALTVTITAKDSNGNVCGTLTFKIKSSNVDFKDDSTLVTINGENYKLSSLLKNDTHISVRYDNKNDHKYAYKKSTAEERAVGVIKTNLTAVANVLKEQNYDSTAVNSAYDRTIDYYTKLLNASTWHGVKSNLLGIDQKASGTESCSFMFEGEQQHVTTSYVHDHDPNLTYNSSLGDNCGIELVTEITGNQEYIVLIDFAKVVQKFYEFLTGAL